MQREKLLQLVTESESILTPDEDSRICFLGLRSRLSPSTENWLNEVYRPFVWPARYPRDLSKYEGLLAPQLVEDIERGQDPWTPTDTRFNDLDLMERESAMGKSNFMLQFMLDTSMSDAEKFPLKFQDLIVTPLGLNVLSDMHGLLTLDTWSKSLNPVGLPGDRFYGPMYIDEGMCDYSETIVSVDPSGRGTDETVAVVLSSANGYVFVRDMRAFRDGYSDSTLSSIVRLGKKYGASRLLVESNFGDGMICELFNRHIIQQQAGFSTEEIRASVRKEERIIETLEPVMNQHKLIIDPKVWEYDYASNPDAPPEKRLEYMLGYQMSRMCREKGAVKHDDRIDALSQGVQWFIDSLAQSAHKAQALRKHEEWTAMMRMMEDDPQRAVDALAMVRPSFPSNPLLALRFGTGLKKWPHLSKGSGAPLCGYAVRLEAPC